MNKAVFLDRDGTLNVEKNYLYKISDFEYLEGAKEALKIFQDLGYLLIVITNQSGIARGFYTEEDFYKLSSWIENDLSESGIVLTKQYYCPHLPDSKIKKYAKDCECRKPRLGLFLRAVEDYEIDLNESIAIGDKERDIAICETDLGKNMHGYLVYSDEESTMDNVSRIKGGLFEIAQNLIKDKK